MTIPFPLYGYFEDSSTKSGKAGLADVTVNIFRITKSSGAVSQIVTGAASFEIGDGFYGYVISAADPLTYDYLSSFTTASSAVSNKRTSAVRWDATEARSDLATQTSVDAIPTAAEIDTQLSGAHGAGTWGSGGTGGVAYTPNRVTDPSGNPLDGVDTWLTTHATDPTIGIQCRAYTIATGLIASPFMLDTGTYYQWRQHSSYTFSNPITVVIT